MRWNVFKYLGDDTHELVGCTEANSAKEAIENLGLSFLCNDVDYISYAKPSNIIEI